MSNEYIHFNNNAQPAINEDTLNLMQQLIKQDITGAVSGDTLPIGATVPYPGTTAPTNWLICDGSAISRTTYQDLFNVIGTTFGSGDGSTTFNLPDMRSRTPVGVDTRDSDLNAVGKTYGEKSHTMTVNELVEHYHPQSLVGGGGGNIGKAAYSWSVPENQYNYTGVDLATRTGGSQPFNIMQPSMATNYIIKAFQTAGVVAQVVNEHSESTTNVYSADYINSKLSGVSAYSSSSGTTGGITLSQSTANSNYAEIYYRDQENNYGYTKVENPNGKKVQLSIAVTNAGATGMYIKARTISISGTSISNVSYGEAEVASGTVSNYNFIYITKVVLHS